MSTRSRLVGVYLSSDPSAMPPVFEKLSLNEDGTFTARIDTGLRCVTTPCPSSENLAGTFTATRSTITLRKGRDEAESGNYGRYAYALSDSAIAALTLSRDAWRNELRRESPQDRECWGAWLDQNGTCRTPADGVYPNQCCASPPGGGAQ